MAGGGNFIFFVLIYQWLSNKIDTFGQDMMGRFMTWVGVVALVVVTLWVLVTGYRVLTGQLRQPLMGVVVNMARIALIVTIATSMTFGSTDLYQFFTNDLGQAINYQVSGSNESLPTAIDKNLALTEVAMSAVNAVQIAPGDTQAAGQQSWDKKLVIFGTSGPAITAAVMLLMYKFALALFIGLGPLFILCLIFDQTKDMFRKWLLYGIGTLFSLAVLNVVTAMVMQLTAGVAAAMWTSTILQHVFGQGSEGINHQSLEQGGLGLILTMLIMTIPPMAAMFFNGTMGQFLYYSAFNRSGLPGPNGQPPGSYGRGYGHAAPAAQQSAQGAPDYSVPLPGVRSGMSVAPTQADVIKPAPQRYT